MKNFTRIVGIIALVAVIGFAFAACGGSSPSDDTEDGVWPGRTLTITGLEAYEGKWAQAWFNFFTENGVKIGLGTVNRSRMQIPDGGTVTFNVYVATKNDTSQAVVNGNYAKHAYTGNYNNAVFTLYVADMEGVNTDSDMTELTNTAVANFSSGNATYAFVA